MQGTFKAKSFYEATTWTSYSCDSCDIQIISKTRWSEPELNSFVGPAETALVSSTCTATAQSFQQGDLVACEASIYSNFLDLRYVWAKTGTNCTNTILLLTDSHQSDTDSIHLASFGKRSFYIRTSEVKYRWSSVTTIVLDTEVWKWNCLSVGATSQLLGCLVKWRVPLADELDFEQLALNMESLYAKQTRTDFCCSK